MLLILIIVLILGALGLLALKQDYRSKTNRYFFLFTLFLSLWIISNYLSNSLTEHDYVLWSNRLIFTFTSLIIYFLCLFSLNYPRQNNETPKSKLIIIQVPTVIVVLLSITPFIVSDIEIMQAYSEIKFGLGVYLYILHFFTLLLLFAIEIATKYKNSFGIEKEKIRYLLIGIIITAVGATITNLILPILFNIYGLSNLGPAFSIGLVSFTTLAIVKHQLFDIRLFIGRIVYYVIASFPPYLTFFGLAFLYERIFGTSLHVVTYIIGIPIAITFTAFLNFFTKLISEYTDTHLINPGYNPLVVLEQHRQRLSNTLDIEKIIHESLFIVARTIRPNNSGVILMGKKSEENWLSVNYKKHSYEDPKEFKIFTEYFFRHPERSINYSNLINSRTLEDTILIQNKHLSSQMEKHDLGVIVVLKEEATIRGLLLVGKKEADEPYNSQEIKFLVSIADSMSLALGRALLYKETQQFNEELQQRVNEATATLQKQNKTLQEALAQLEEVRRQEKDMLDVMGHELRTPISIARNALLSMRKHLQTNELDPERIKKYNKMAVEGTRREIALVETLLSTTKLEGNRMEVNLIPMSLMRVIKYSLRSHADLAEKNKTEVIYHKPEQDIIVMADKVRIQEIMDNFLNNAIKYTGQGKVEISVYEKDGLGWIDVKDNGIGISEENLEHLGKKFFRAQNLYNKSKNVVNPSGTGLGLFVSFLLIEIMKGKKKIISKEGEGSTFGFGLPIYSGPMPVEEETPEELEELEQNGESGKQPEGQGQNTETNQQSDGQEQGEKVAEHAEAQESNTGTEGQEGEQDAHAEVEHQTEEQKPTEEAEGQPETQALNEEAGEQIIGQASNEGN